MKIYGNNCIDETLRHFFVKSYEKEREINRSKQLMSACCNKIVNCKKIEIVASFIISLS